MYDYIDAIVMYVGAYQAHEGRGPAADIEEVALLAACEPVNNSRGFFKAIVRLAVTKALLIPEVLLVVTRGTAETVFGNDAANRAVQAFPSVVHEVSPRRLVDVDTVVLSHAVPIVD